MPDDDRMLADTLCRDHLAVVPGGGAIGTEVALLTQLEHAVGSSSGKGSAGGGADPSTRSLIDGSAFEVRRRIESVVNTGLARMGGGGTQGTLTYRAGVWLYALPPGGYTHMVPTLVAWEQAIRNLLDPPQQVPLRGVHCAECGYAQVLLPDPLEPGKDVQAPALLATLDGQPHAECRVCGVHYDTTRLCSLGD